MTNPVWTNIDDLGTEYVLVPYVKYCAIFDVPLSRDFHTVPYCICIWICTQRLFRTPYRVQIDRMTWNAWRKSTGPHRERARRRSNSPNSQPDLTTLSPFVSPQVRPRASSLQRGKQGELGQPHPSLLPGGSWLRWMERIRSCDSFMSRASNSGSGGQQRPITVQCKDPLPRSVLSYFWESFTHISSPKWKTGSGGYSDAAIALQLHCSCKGALPN